jgi:putative transposase
MPIITPSSSAQPSKPADNKYGDIQRYTCNDCFKRFTIILGFERMHATPKVITSAIQLYFTGKSFRNVQKFLKLQGVNVSHFGVYKWRITRREDCSAQ